MHNFVKPLIPKNTINRTLLRLHNIHYVEIDYTIPAYITTGRKLITSLSVTDIRAMLAAFGYERETQALGEGAQFEPDPFYALYRTVLIESGFEILQDDREALEYYHAHSEDAGKCRDLKAKWFGG